jgi:tRNA threonylcarbamoyladenosine biosynthesis protein TsaE
MRQHERPTGDQVLLHVDFYRLERSEEAWNLGLGDWLNDPRAVMIIEWPERALEILPAERLWIQLDCEDHDRRRLLFSAEGQSYEELLQEFRQTAFGV